MQAVGNALYTTMDIVGSSQNCGGIYRSTDDGATWQATALQNVPCIALAARGNTLFTGTHYGVYRSINDGAAWTQTNTALRSALSPTVLYATGNTLYTGVTATAGGTSNALQRTTDGGQHWTIVNTGLINQRFDGDFQMRALVQSGAKLFGLDAADNFCRSTDDGDN